MNHVTQDEILQSRVINILREPRHLDTAPKKFKVSTIGKTKVYGIAEVFAQTYNMVISKIDQTRECRVMLSNTEAIVDHIPFACLKTLLLMNVNTDPKLSKTCVVLFQKIVENSTRQDTDNNIHITVDTFHDLLLNLNVSSVYARALVKGIFLSAYPEDYRKRIWYELLNVSSERYEGLRNVGIKYLADHPELETEADIRGELRRAFKEATHVKGFISKFPKDLSSPAKGMAYLTFMNHPEVFTEYNRSLVGEEPKDGD